MLRTRTIYETVTVAREVPVELVLADKKLRRAKRKTPAQRVAQREWDKECLSNLERLWQWMMVNKGKDIGFFDFYLKINPLREGVITRYASLIDVPEYMNRYLKLKERKHQ